MAEMKSTKAGKGSAKRDAQAGFTKAERTAMRGRARELKAQARAAGTRSEGETAVLAAIARMPAPDRAMAERLHTLVTASAPELQPKTWYGMPAYASQQG